MPGTSCHTLALLAATIALTTAPSAGAAEARYLVEVLVFRHVDSGAEAMPIEALREWPRALDLQNPGAPPTPVAAEHSGSTFRDIRSRLGRLQAYQPLALLAFEQSQSDYHPPVRLHDDEVIDEYVAFRAPVFWLDLTDAFLFQDLWLQQFRLDGSVQLRRSRFLHVELDLEYRVDAPHGSQAAVHSALPPDQDDVQPPPFRIHRLHQSRQVRSNELNYFDTAYLGAIVRVTPLAAN